MTRQRSSGQQRRRATAPRRIVAAFAVTVLGAVGFAAVYVLGGQTQLEGATLAVAFAGLAFGLATWARDLLPTGGFVEEHEPFASSRRERQLAAADLRDEESPLRRRGLLAALSLALGALGAAALFPLRSLLPTGRPGPAQALSRTPWAAGVRLVTADGRPVRATDVTGDSVLTVFPEGHTKAGDAPAFLVRLDLARMRVPPPGGDVDGVVGYSLLCTHAGCPVGLYVQGTARMLCPCHQSAFDLLAAARPIAGPAARALPGLPLTVDSDGMLRARGDFTRAPGPGYWSRP